MICSSKSHVRWYRMPLAIFIVLLLQIDTLIADGAECERHSKSCRSVIHDEQGYISSPRYPLTYEDHTCCSWTFEIARGSVLVMRVQDLDIEEDANCDIPPCCRHSWLSLPQKGKRDSQKICGHNKGRQIIAVPAPKATVKFYTSKVVKGGRGFNLTYTIEDESTACLGWDERPCGGGDPLCYNESHRCDGAKYCPSGIDEADCGDCPLGEIQCENKDGCFTQQQMCDGKPDCVDFSDEINCGYCRDGEALCSSDGSKCFNATLERCNGELDCPCGEDEVNCNPACPGKIACPNSNGCFTPADLRSDGQACVNPLDVVGSRMMGVFRNGKFRCDNGQCISYSLWCNGVDNCGDNSDEQTCIKNSVITAAIMGSLTCGLLLVIAVGCMCRLYSLRLAVSNSYRVHQNERSLTPSRMRVPLPHPDEEFFNREPPPAYSVAVSDCQQLQRLSTQPGNSRLFTVSPTDQNQTQRHMHGSTRRPRRHPSRRRSQRGTAGRSSPMTDPSIFTQSRPRATNFTNILPQCMPGVPVASTLETSLASQRESMIVSSQADNKTSACPAASQMCANSGERSMPETCAVSTNLEGDVSSSSTSTSLSPSHDSMTSSTSLMSYLSGNDDDTQLLVLPSS